MIMAVLRVAFTLALVLTLAVCAAEDVPVFIWGDIEYSSQRSNPLQKTPTAEFQRLLLSEAKSEPLVVAFVEETLSVEDLSRRDADGASSLPYLHSNLGKSLYLPAVQSPVRSINKFADAESTRRVRLTEGGLSAEPRLAGASLLVVELADAREDEPRAALLRRHDSFMSQRVAELRRERGAVVAVYTAHYPSWSVAGDGAPVRTRRHLLQAAANVTDSAGSFYNISGDLLLYVNRISVTTNGGPAQTIDLPAGGPTVSVNDTARAMTVHIDATNYTVLLNFRSQAGYWFLNEADVTSKATGETEAIASSAVYALDGFSYHCTSGVLFSGPNSTFTLRLDDFQIQPFFGGSPAEQFGAAFDCTGFTSVPIWSGLFVVFIMLSIFFYGVSMMLDIRTMDRFDDPKGKTITINATE